MAKGSKPKMKMWRKNAAELNENARSTGDFSGHKGRANKSGSAMNMSGMPSTLFMKMWSSKVSTGEIFYHFTPKEQSTINEEAPE